MCSRRPSRSPRASSLSSERRIALGHDGPDRVGTMAATVDATDSAFRLPARLLCKDLLRFQSRDVISIVSRPRMGVIISGQGQV